jgi:trehalose 6-phosphate synthase
MPVGQRPLVIVSNRGPVGFRFDDAGRAVPGRPAGGLATGLRPLLREGATWIASAVSDADRAAAEAGGGQVDIGGGLTVRLLSPDPSQYRMAYDTIANATLWFLHHGLWDLPRRPIFDRRWRDAWTAYVAWNEEVVTVVAHEVERLGPDTVVLVQDYHLGLAGGALRRAGVDGPCVHFSHTPFAGAEAIGVLPADVARALLDGMAAFTACGFHTDRWAQRFLAACEEVGVEAPPTFSQPLAPDLGHLRDVAAGADCAAAIAALDADIGDRTAIVRVDRLELSKNLLRGFLAFELLLERRPDLRDRVVFAALAYRSREGVLDYLAYEQEVTGVVDRINARFGRPGWTPIQLFIGDDHPLSVAALRRYDVLLVNPVRDGLNLVAFEGPAVNERDGVVCLSTEAGAHAMLGDVVESVHPFDVDGTAAALERAISLGGAERAARAARLRAAVEAVTPSAWLDAQLAAAGVM